MSIIHLAIIKTSDGKITIARGEEKRFLRNLESIQNSVNAHVYNQVSQEVTCAKDEDELWQEFLKNIPFGKKRDFAISKYKIWQANSSLIWLVFSNPDLFIIFPLESNRMIPFKTPGEDEYISKNNPTTS